MNNDIRKNWENLYVPESILKAIEKEGFVYPTEIQKLTLPSAIRDQLDILGAAATGTGKTLAFGIPMITRILDDKKKEVEAFHKANEVQSQEDSDVDMSEDGESEEYDIEPSGSELEDTWNDEDIKPDIAIGVDFMTPKVDNAKPYQHIYGLVLTPTRELACQVADHLKKICQFTDLKVCAIFGGMSVEKQERLLSYRPEIVVVTPGRFWSFIQDQDLHAMTVHKTSVLVLDEADRLLEKGHFSELQNLMEWLKTTNVDGASKIRRQTFVFSATLTFVHSSTKNDRRKVSTKDKLKNIIDELGMSANPKIIDTALDVAQLRQWKILCPTQPDKDSRLFWFLRHHPGRTIVFVNSKNSVRRLTSVLKQLGLHPKSLFADMQEKQRLKNLEIFSKSADSLMIASDVAARGLDIPRVDYVVHFDVAHTAETHLHRSGRTARATHPGHSVIMVNPKETGPLRKLLTSLKKTEDDISQIPIGDIGIIEKVVALARRVDSESHVASKVDKDKDWFTKMAAEADVILDEDFAPVLKKASHTSKSLDQPKKELARLLEDLSKSAINYVSPIPRVGQPTTQENITDHVVTVVAKEPVTVKRRRNKGPNAGSKKMKTDE